MSVDEFAAVVRIDFLDLKRQAARDVHERLKNLRLPTPPAPATGLNITMLAVSGLAMLGLGMLTPQKPLWDGTALTAAIAQPNDRRHEAMRLQCACLTAPGGFVKLCSIAEQ